MLRWTLHKKIENNPSHCISLLRVLVKEVEKVSDIGYFSVKKVKLHLSQPYQKLCNVTFISVRGVKAVPSVPFHHLQINVMMAATSCSRSTGHK